MTAASNGAVLAAAIGPVWGGVSIAVLSVVCYNVGYVLEKGALAALPPLGRPSLAMVSTVLSSRRWVAGFVIMLAGLGLQVAALMLAPVSVVQPILAGGTVALVVAARVVLGERLGLRDRLAVTMLILGVAAVAVSSHSGNHPGRTTDNWALVLMAGAAALVFAWSTARSPRRMGAAGTVATIGLYYGTGAIGEKGVANDLVRHGVVKGAVAALASPYPWLFVVATAAGMLLFQVALQRYPASVLVPACNGMSAGYAVVGAVVVFAEPWSAGGWHGGVLLTGYAAIVAGLVLLTASADTDDDADAFFAVGAASTDEADAWRGK